MTHTELENQIQQADDEESKGNFELSERLANEVLAELEKQNSSIESDELLRLQCEAILAIAKTNLRQGNYDKALEQAQRGLAIASDANLNGIKARAWNIIGNVYYSLGSYDKALEYYNKALAANQELGEKSGVARVTMNIGNVYKSLGSYDKALEYYNKAFAAHQELGDKSEVASVTGNIGLVYNFLGSYDKALEYYHMALAAHQELEDKSGVARDTGNIGNVYYSLGSYDKSLEYYHMALASHKELGEKSSVARVTGNIGNVYYSLGSYDKALEYYHMAIASHKELGNKSRVANVTVNIGNVYYSLGSYDKALEYYHMAIASHKELGEKSSVAGVTGNIGSVYADKKFDGYDPIKGEEYLLKAIALSTEIGAKSRLAAQYNDLTHLYKNEKRWEEAFIYYKKHIEVKDELNIEETKKQDSIRQQQKAIELEKAAASARLSATTSLLHKVLPESIANRIAEGEENIADYFPAVSILFADIEGFTPMSADMPAYVVVKFLNHVFSEFDRIMKKHGCEKIKTIGDGYMAVAGAPIECVDHAERITLAALDMMKPIELPDEIKSFIPSGKKFSIRIGLHTGSVVAGVVGEDRFVYDIYSDAVNTAARMESHGESGKIHVSSDFMRHLLNRFAQTKNTTHGITFENRGEMEVKGKGMMKTYFLEN
jgi:adenylate cyclase